LDDMLVKSRLKQITGLLIGGDKTFTQLQDKTGFSPTTVSRYLASLENKGHIERKIQGKRIVYSLKRDKSMLSLIWDLLGFQEKGAWYVHVDAPSYHQYGLKTDFACLPRTDQGLSQKTELALEKAFIEVLVHTADSSNLPLKSRNGKFLAAFEIDLNRFMKEMKKTRNKVPQYGQSNMEKEVMEKVECFKQHREKLIVKS